MRSQLTLQKEMACARWQLLVSTKRRRADQAISPMIFLSRIKSGKKVFKWNRRKGWERALWRLLADKLNDSVIAEVKQRNPRRPLDDDFAWLNEPVARAIGQPLEDIPQLLGSRLSSYYQFVIAFHGSRPVLPRDFLAYGLKPSDTAALQNRAIELFGDSEDLQKAIVELRDGNYERHNNRGVWLCMTKEAFLQVHNHYLLEGSEYLAAIAGRLGQSAKLRAIGSPVIVECLVSNGFLDSKFWQNMSRYMIKDYFGRLLSPSEKRPVNTYCIRITETIPPGNMLRVHEFAENKRTHQRTDFQTGVKQCFEVTTLRPFKD